MKSKKSNNIIKAFSIFFSSIKSYLLYLDQTTKYLFFPIFGQIISLTIIFTITYFYRMNIEHIKYSVPFLNNGNTLFILLLVIISPFLLIFLKAFYDYIIAFSALNILFYTTSGKKKVKNIDLHSNNKVIERKLFIYIILLLITNIILIPPLIIIAPILWIFLCLSFQVFAFENNLSPIQIIQRSIELVKGNVIATIIMLLLCFLLTYCYLPSLFIWLCDKFQITSFLSEEIKPFAELISNDYLYNILIYINIPAIEQPMTISRGIAESIISFIITGLTLPYRCCCFTELYKLYDKERIKDFSKESDEIIRRATGKKRKT